MTLLAQATGCKCKRMSLKIQQEINLVTLHCFIMDIFASVDYARMFLNKRTSCETQIVTDPKPINGNF